MSNANPGFRRFAGMIIVALALFSASAPAAAGERIGVILMHGEQGAPSRVIDRLAQALEKGGYLVGRPDMCWSARRSYDALFDDCLAVIDESIVKLKNLGANAIVVGGFSLGGNAAIAYGAGHRGLLGVFAMAPAHDAREAAENPDVAASVKQARELVARGKGDEETPLADIAFGPAGPYSSEVATTPAIYLSFFGSDSTARIADNARKLAAPLLWVAGAEDATQSDGPGSAFSAAPANPLNRYVSVPGNHLSTPDHSPDAVLAWLKDLSAM
jgi:pimeloyl-ACP methyl ester carboxylesterase